MEELGSCELGTQEYWDNRYKEEIVNYNSNGDVGEIWFGEDIVDRIVRWLHKFSRDDKSKSILDLGCGNGMLLIELFREGFTNLKGVDYSQDAINLAKAIASKENLDVNFEVDDILKKSDLCADIILDKGTYDAISLSEDSKNNRNAYIENVCSYLGKDGVLVVTSCNWTETELRDQFGERFVLYEIIPTPQFKFGGKVGNVVSSVVFKRK